jgi:16S rRNA processing protein RimM
VSRESNNCGETEDVVIARVVKARGIRGEVACTLETDFPERFDSLERVTMWMADDTRRSLAIESAWFHKGRVILKFEGVDTMSAAELLVGARLVISESAQTALEEDEFYEHQLIGSEVVTAGGEQVGKVIRLMRTGAADVLVIEGEDGRELLVPFADDICAEVDVDRRRITINPPEGLLDL